MKRLFPIPLAGVLLLACLLCGPSSGKPLDKRPAAVQEIPENHAGPEWADRHGPDVRSQGESACLECHRRLDCSSCHDGIARPMRIHPGNWVVLHPMAARQSEPECSTCHRHQSFCLKCHDELGYTRRHNAEIRRFAIHPAGWASCAPTPDHHAYQARRSLSACVSCHRESECIRCHAPGGACGGVSIHRGSTPEALERLKRSNDRACLKCHPGGVDR